MTRSRFKELNRFYHFNENALATQSRDDPTYGRNYKVRPLLTKLRDACLLTEPKERISVDEQMIPYKGKNSLRQYLPKKPKKWGFKVMARCDVCGLTYGFLMYDGNGPNVTKSCGSQSSDYVVKVCETLPKQMNLKVYILTIGLRALDYKFF